MSKQIADEIRLDAAAKMAAIKAARKRSDKANLHSYSVIIPCHNRQESLFLCLYSLQKAASFASKTPEVIVVYPKGTPPPITGGRCLLNLRVIEHDTDHGLRLAPNEPEPYWKSKALNAGIEAATGDVLCFLDADAIVGIEFFSSYAMQLYPLLTKCLGLYSRRCFRVRYVTLLDAMRHLYRAGDRKELPLAYEAYGAADSDIRDLVSKPTDPTLCFGNSQYAIRRDILGSMRYDERYIGRGYEDIEMNRRLGQTVGYRALIRDLPRVLHIKHEYTPGYGMDRWNQRNRRRFYRDRTQWYVCPNPHVGCITHEALTRARKPFDGPSVGLCVMWPPNDAWELSAVIPELDDVYRVAEDGTHTLISKATE